MKALKLICALPLALATAGLTQEIIKLPPGSAADVTRPDDLFNLPPGTWHFAKHLWQGRETCTPDQCEAGFTSGDLVVSAEHSGEAVRIIAGVRGCTGTAFSEMETGKKPGKSTRKRVAKQVDKVVKGLGKTCKLAVPQAPPLDVALLFPAAAVPVP